MRPQPARKLPIYRFCASTALSTKPVERSMRCAMQISVVTGSMTRALHNIIQLFLLLEHIEELVQLQCYPAVLWHCVLTKALADPLSNVGVHCTRTCFLHDPVPNIDLCV